MVRMLWIGLLAAAAVAVTAVASSRATAEDAGVLLIRVADGTRERLTPREGALTWSRDGRRAFVSADPDRPSYVFAEWVDGQRVSERVVRSPDVIGGEVAVSPGERRIAFVQAARDPRRLITGVLSVARLRARASRRLLTRAVGTPAWSRHGKRIAVERYSRQEATGVVGRPEEPAHVAIVRADGSGRVVSAGPGGAPTWLPDGRLLVLVETRRSADLVVTRPDGSARRTVLRDIRGGEWGVSPDGRHVAVAAAGQGSPDYHVTVVDLAGGAARRVSDETADDVAWAPDGRRLAATVGDRLLLLDPFGQAAQQLLARIPERDLSRPAWSPDGQRLAVSAAVVRPYRD